MDVYQSLSRSDARHVDATAAMSADERRALVGTADLRTKILDLRGLASTRVTSLRGGTPRPTGSSPEIWSQRLSVSGFLVCALTVAFVGSR